MKFGISHRTTYRYSEAVVQSQHVIHLAPRRTHHQNTHRHSLIIEPAPTFRHDASDAFANPVTMIEIELPHQDLVIHSRATIETAPAFAVDEAGTTPWDRLDHALYHGSGPIDLDVVQFRSPSQLTNPTLGIAEYAAMSFPPGRPVIQASRHLMGRIYDDFTFDATATDVSTPITQVFAQRRGVCQDFAHLTLACLRALRVPARYVSGYILTRPPPGQPKLQGADASHAWVDVWSPESGWLGLDPTNGITAGEEHIIIATGREYNDVSPISGVLLGGGEHSVDVSVDVSPF
jgi:transglutaminase-like putative cysteine protease